MRKRMESMARIGTSTFYGLTLIGFFSLFALKLIAMSSLIWTGLWTVLGVLSSGTLVYLAVTGEKDEKDQNDFNLVLGLFGLMLAALLCCIIYKIR